MLDGSEVDIPPAEPEPVVGAVAQSSPSVSVAQYVGSSHTPSSLYAQTEAILAA